MANYTVHDDLTTGRTPCRYDTICSVSLGELADCRSCDNCVTLHHRSSNSYSLTALRDRADHYIFALWFLLSSSSSFFFLSFFFSRLISAVADWMYTIVAQRCGLGANLRCRSEKCCTRLAENTRRKKSPKTCHLGTIGQLCWAIPYIFATKARINNRKKLLNSTCLTML